MKSIIVFALCTLLAACGSDNTSAVTSQPIDYFNKPHSVAMVVADQPNNIQAADLIISGVSRTTDIVTLDFNITVTNSGTIPQDVDIIISGRDRYNLEAIVPVITASMQPGETRIISQQKQFTAVLLHQVETWTVQSVGPTPQPTGPGAETPIVTEEPPAPQSIETLSGTIIDPTGAINLYSFDTTVIPNTAANMNFSSNYHINNTGTASANIGLLFEGKTSNGQLVFSKTLNMAVAPNQTFGKIDFEATLTIDQFNSISNWDIVSITIY